MSPLALILVLAAAAVGYRRPNWGVMVFLALVPLEAVLPETLAGASAIFQSPLAALGGAAVLGSALGLLSTGKLQPGAGGASPALAVGILFIGWVFLAHPGTSWSGVDGRNWIFTFGQLWLLALVAGSALDTDEKHTLAMTVFALACVISAVVATANGTIADDRGEGIRVSGLGVGANASSRQYAIGMIFMMFVHLRATKVWLRVSTLVAVAVLLIGVIFTQSRAGLVLAPLGLVSVAFVSAQRKVVRTALAALVVGLLVVFLLPGGAVNSVLNWFTPTGLGDYSQNDSLETNIRYRLWQAGMDIWRDNPVVGVGPGQFPEVIPEYMPESKMLQYGNITPHSLYVAVLTQTGMIGMGLFGAMMTIALIRAARAARQSGGKSPAVAWGLAFLILAIGGIVKDETVDKLMWLCMGVAAASPLRAWLPVRRRSPVGPPMIRGRRVMQRTS